MKIKRRLAEMWTQEESKNGKATNTFLCDICYEEKKIDSMTTFNCNHRFCSDCLKEDLKEKIKSFKVKSESFICASCKKEIEPSVV